MAMLHAICSMPHATWLFVSDAVPRPRPCIYAFRLCFQFIFCSRFRFSSPVPSSGPVFRATHHASCTSFPAAHMNLCFVSRLCVFRFSFLVSFSRTPCPAPALHFGAFTRICASLFVFVFRSSFVFRTSLLGACTTPSVSVSRCRVLRPAPRTPHPAPLNVILLGVLTAPAHYTSCRPNKAARTR